MQRRVPCRAEGRAEILTRFRPPFRLRTYLVAAFVLCAGAPLAVSTVAVGRIIADHVRAQHLEQMDALAEIAASRIRAELASLADRARLVASRTQLRHRLREFTRHGRAADRDVIGRIVRDALGAVPSLERITIYDPAGAPVFSTARDPVALEHRPGMDEERLYVAEAPHGFDCRATLPMTLDGELVGHVTVIVTGDAIRAMLRDRTGLGRTGEWLFARRADNGDALFLTPLRYDPLAGFKRTVPRTAVNVPTTIAVQGREGRHEDVVDYRGEPVLAATRYMPGPEWGLVAKIDEREVNGLVDELHTTVWAVAAGAVVVAVLLALAFARRIAGPMERLRRESMVHAAGDLSGRVPETGPVEAREAAQAFNVMAQAVQSMRDDLEERVAARTSELAAANRELDAFAHTASHDLRAPLRSLHGFSEILLEDHAADLDEEARGYLRRIASASQRMATLIEDLLRFAHAGRSDLRRATVDLTKLAREIDADLRRAHAGPAVESVIEDGLEAHADPGLLRVVLANLMGNAWKYSSKVAAPRVEVGMRDDPEHGRAFFVRDNGVGFPMKYAPRVFEPFRRLHAEHEFTGTGVGLATVHRILDRHGGRIWVESRENEGTTFSFVLPPPAR